MGKTAWPAKRLALISLSTLPFTLLTAPDAVAATRVPLRGVDRFCDFTQNAPVQTFGYGTVSAVINRTGSGVSADVSMFYGTPDSHFDVVLIEAPRPSSATCGPGDPGTAAGGFNTDGAGAGAVTVQDHPRSGTTGVWLTVRRPSDHSQTPAEFYSSDFIAPV